MKNKIGKGLALVFASYLLVALCFVTNALADAVNVFDGAGVLTQEEVTSLDNKLSGVYDNYGLDTVVVILNEDLSEEEQTNFGGYAEDLLQELEIKDGVILLLNMSTRDWAMSTCGVGDEWIDTAGREWIMDKVLPKLGEDDFNGAFDTWVYWIGEFSQQGFNGEPYSEGNLPHPGVPVLLIVGDVALSFIVAFSIAYSIKDKLNSVHAESDATYYLTPGSLNLTYQADNYIGTTTTTRTIKKDSDSSSTSSSSGSTSSGKF